MYKRTADSAQFFSVTANHSLRVKTNGTGLAGVSNSNKSPEEELAALEVKRRALFDTFNRLNAMKLSLLGQLANAVPPIDPVWKGKVEMMIRQRRADLQNTQRELGAINKHLGRLRTEIGRDVWRETLEVVAREHIGRAKWSAIVVETNRRCQERQRNG